MAVSTSPKWGITLGIIFIVIYLVLQLSRPLFFTFQVVEGEIVKYEYVPNRKSKDSKLRIWLNDTIKKPYKISYKAEQKKINEKLGELKQIKIWVNNECEIQQLITKDKKFIDYQWFVWLHTIFFVVGVIFHIVIYIAIKKDSININNYSEFWDYYFGGRPLIMKETNKPYDPKDFSW